MGFDADSNFGNLIPLLQVILGYCCIMKLWLRLELNRVSYIWFWLISRESRQASCRDLIGYIIPLAPVYISPFSQESSHT